ncbi:LAMI_0H12354g1_1 [Lachancea mirantina]|uniref:LAMI_0H12354g1_1 n=1 Tax=Lachancea mirantina TaxID=1230905 RepID=A0A1G4KHJ5_9SACH|nr:LAMI_0H12354g1_1 [Lachancea mirantina]
MKHTLYCVQAPVVRLVTSALNGRSVIGLVANFALGFAPVAAWLAAFKNAGRIPVSARPAIHSSWAFLADAFLFGDAFQELVTQYGEGMRVASVVTWVTASQFALLVLAALPVAAWRLRGANAKHAGSRDRDPASLQLLLALPLLAFVALDAIHLLAAQRDFTSFKDMLAWTSYVLLHLLAPIFTAVYLYVFRAPGTVRAFALALGIQNLAGVCTHLLVPTAAPWFIHMYGARDVEHVTYEQEGFAAGLTRVDTHLGTHLNTSGFHRSPIVFGAVPSLHSAMAVQCFLFVVVSLLPALRVRGAGAGFGPAAAESFVLSAVPVASRPKDGDDDLESGAAAEVGGDDVMGYVVSDEESSRKSGDGVVSAVVSCEESSDSASHEAAEAAAEATAKLLAPAGADGAGGAQGASGGSSTAPTASSRWLYIFRRPVISFTLATAFPLLQWWSTMYLDHHFRFDLFVGLLYALTAFHIVDALLLTPRVTSVWLDIRAGTREDPRNEACTMGMRVFRGTRLEWFFDPLA